jgi:hypothetical protein
MDTICGVKHQHILRGNYQKTKCVVSIPRGFLDQHNVEFFTRLEILRSMLEFDSFKFDLDSDYHS